MADPNGQAPQHAPPAHGPAGAAPAPTAGAGAPTGVALLRARLAHGNVPPDEVAHLIVGHPQDRDAMLALLHGARGNAYVQQVVAATKAADSTAQAQAVSAELGKAIGLFRGQVSAEEAHHRQVKAARDKQGMVGAAEEDLEAGEETIAHLWRSVWHEQQKTYLAAHVVVPDLGIWTKVYAKLDQAAAAATRYAQSQAASDLELVRTLVHEAQADYTQCHQLVTEYTGRLASGAQALAVVGTCVVIVATIATGGLAAAAGAGLIGIAATTAVVTFGAEVGVGALENKTGVTAARGGDDSFQALVKQAGIDAAVTFAGVLVGGALSKVFMTGLSSVVAKLLGKNAPVVMAQLGITATADLAEHLLSPLQKFLVYSGAGLASSPVTTAVQVVLSGASSKMTTSQFVDLVIDNAIKQGVVQAFVGAVTHGYRPTAAKAPAAKPRAPSVTKTFTDQAGVTGGKVTASDTAQIQLALQQGKVTAEQVAKFENDTLTGDAKVAFDKQIGSATTSGTADVNLAGGKITASESAQIQLALKQGKVTAEQVAKFEAGTLTGDAKVAFDKQIGSVSTSGNTDVSLAGGKITANESAQIQLALQQGKVTAEQVAKFEAGTLTGDAKVAFDKQIGSATTSGTADVNLAGGKITASDSAQIQLALKQGKVTADQVAKFEAGTLTGDAKVDFEKQVGSATITGNADVNLAGGKITATQEAKVVALLRQGKITAQEAAKYVDGTLTIDEQVAFEKQLAGATLTADESANLAGGRLTFHEKAQLVKALKNGKVTADEVVQFQNGKLTAEQQTELQTRFGSVEVTAGDMVEYAQGIIDADVYVKLVEHDGATRTTEAADAGVTVGPGGTSAHVDLKFGITDGKAGFGGKVAISPGAVDTSLGVRVGTVHFQVVFRGLYLREIDASIDGQTMLNSILKAVGNYGVKAATSTTYVAGLVKFVSAHLGPIEAELKRLGIAVNPEQGKDDTASFAGAVAVLTPEDAATLKQAGLLSAAGQLDTSLPMDSFIQKLETTSLDIDQRAAILAEYNGASVR